VPYTSLFKKFVSTALTGLILTAAPATAEEAVPKIALSARLTSDAFGIVQGGAERGMRVLSNLDLVADLDLAALAGWRGARAKLHVLDSEGGRPNDLAATLQGVDNIEVGRTRTKLYQAWVEQDFAGGKASLLLGLADLNADFYQNDSAGVLLAPAFGIGSELAATGPNGPSIFPSTALTARLRVTPRPDIYTKAAVVNARSGVIGDPGGIDWHMRDGALLIGEVGWVGRGKIAVGYWRYTKRQKDISAAGPDGQLLGKIANGAYLLVDQPLDQGDSQMVQASAFARVGVSDGATTPFQGGWQVGVLVNGIFANRPESQFSFGINRGNLSRGLRETASAADNPMASAETGFEITVADQLTPNLRIQPDLQYIVNPAGDASAKPVISVGLRIVLTASKEFAR
jgi:porin